ncbi:glycosyltransferase family 2 protein [Pseudoalteromonas sp. S1612]|uniref:glycosyltransferase family 2 protein n=1 Tax=Pseudoalteromonas sp. S1612 TaxID=579507 RepID=UPI00110A8AD6|nr:glycosyltransferase family 2 protein [Pseudoalteromonas sp. S1612]TMP52359.1 hypothetical protein CWB78_16490 [Pseudoalteromonas sp. S1612]
MKISIVVPVYNVENYLEVALDSILAQTYQHYEVIIIDDGSTDSSPSLCNKYLTDKRFNYYRQANQGLSVARNNGFEKATGEIVYFFDSDDLLRKDAFSAWISEFSNEDVKAILFNADVFYDGGANEFKPSYHRQKTNETKIYKSDEYFAKSLGKGCYFASACCYVARKAILEENIFLPNIIHEDELYYFQIFAANQHSISVMSESFFLRRVRDGSIMTSSKIEKRIDGYTEVLLGMVKSQSNVKNKKVNLVMSNILRQIVLLYANASNNDSARFVPLSSRLNIWKLYFSAVRFVPIDFKLMMLATFPDYYIYKFNRKVK